MRRFLLACLLWLVCVPAWAAIAVFNIGVAQGTGGATLAITVGVGGVPSGATIAVCAFEQANVAIGGSVADTPANSYGAIAGVSLNNTQSLGFVRCFYAFNVAALVNGNSITYTKVASGDATGITASYITGLISGDTVDSATVNTAFGSSATPSITSGTPSVSGEIFIGWMARTSPGTWTQAAGWAAPPNVPGSANMAGSLINAGTGTETYNPTLSQSATWAAVIASFKPPAAAGGVRRPSSCSASDVDHG